MAPTTTPLDAMSAPLALGSDNVDLMTLDLASSTLADPRALLTSVASIESTLATILLRSATTHTPSKAIAIHRPCTHHDTQRALDTSPLSLCDRSAHANQVVLSDCYTTHLPRLRTLVWDWLMCLVRHATRHLMDSAEDDDDPTWATWDAISTRASALMSALSGPASAGERTRTFLFDTLKLQVRETSLQASDLGGTTWGAGVVLASLMDQRLVSFPCGASILELGSGTGLGGLAAQAVDPSAHIIMTDYHEGVLDTLRSNVALNCSSLPHHVQVLQLDWRWYLTPGHASVPSLPDLDAIMAADVVYERASVAAIHAVLSTLTASAKHPMLVLIVLPMRPRYHEDVMEFERLVASAFCPRQVAIEYKGAWYKAYGNDRAMETMPHLFAPSHRSCDPSPNECV